LTVSGESGKLKGCALRLVGMEPRRDLVAVTVLLLIMVGRTVPDLIHTNSSAININAVSYFALNSFTL
jgi:hypothetical protein